MFPYKAANFLDWITVTCSNQLNYRSIVREFFILFVVVYPEITPQLLRHYLKLLSNEDLNLDIQNSNLIYYHYTIGQILLRASDRTQPTTSSLQVRCNYQLCYKGKYNIQRAVWESNPSTWFCRPGPKPLGTPAQIVGLGGFEPPTPTLSVWYSNL